MSSRQDQIVYSGSEQYTTKEREAPGSIPVSLNGEPLVRALATAYVMFQIPDLGKQKSFLNDFGLVEVSATDQIMYMRGYGSDAYIYEARKGDKAKFLGAGFVLGTEKELNQMSAETGIPIENIEGPGGGRRVRLIDPDGFNVDLVYGREVMAPLETRRERLPVNSPAQKNRINQGLRTALSPSAVERFGHYVLMVSDFEASWKWYRKHLGLLLTDVLCSSTGRPMLAFSRFDLGDVPTDHHSVALSAGPTPGHMHHAYETLDQDSIGQGQQFLRSKGWQHFWGIGRHILGSQVFDYWVDPHGFEVEHYADGDVFDSSYPTQYHLMDRGGLWAWGDDIPKDMTPKISLKMLRKLAFGGRAVRQILLELKQAMGRAPRPWLK